MIEPIRLSFDVACPVERAFEVWTADIDRWWPADHTVTGTDDLRVVLEPRPGGRIFERTPAGIEHDWGEVTIWEPPSRFGYLWHLNRDRSDATEVEIRFVPAGSTATRVEIEHRGWEHLGADGETWRDRNRGGWATLLPKFVTAATTRHRTVVWDKENGYGTEFADVELGSDRLAAVGVAIGWDPLAYRLEYSLETGAGWVTTRLRVSSHGDGWGRTLDLRRAEAGVWTIAASADGDLDLEPPGGDTQSVAAALDCDLGNAPLTNTMPVLRHDLLHRDGSLDFVMAWVAVPALAVRASAQRYTTLGSGFDGLRRIEYRSGEFVSELVFDGDGICVEYPRLGLAVMPP